MMNLPDGAAMILKRLHDAGYAAYVVGGCVRDALLSREPKDWDVCTSARPEEMQRVFADQHVIETSLKHGTLTVMRGRVPYEVTTFRVDGAYTDHRHPDSVSFVDDVTQDLSRRDFTVNAMAWSPESGLVDAFGGQEDLRRGVIRCVGEADRRFEEDALRILRALRFASAYGFAIEPETARAARTRRETLLDVAPERVRAELAKLLCGQGAGAILREYADILQVVLPEIGPMRGFDQRTPWHRYDVWEHTVRTVENAPATEILRLTMLLHDAGKPGSFTVDEKGVGHAYGHAARSAELARAALTRLRVDNDTRDAVLLLVSRHDVPLSPDWKTLRRRLNQFGEETLRRLIDVRRADSLGKGTEPPADINAWAESMRAALDALLATAPCVTLKQLAVSGSDLRALGLPPGPALGACLNALLARVVDGDLPNDRAALLAAACSWRG